MNNILRCAYMDISELNTYLIRNIHKSCGDFLSKAPYVDEYDRFRRDAEIYCYSAMSSILKQVSTNHAYSQWMQQSAANLYCENDEENNRACIPQHALLSVKGDDDDLCDEQSVGWYIGVHTYMHCLAYDTFDFQDIFLSSWNKYFSVEFQAKERGYNSKALNISGNFIEKCLQVNRDVLIDYRWRIRMKCPYGCNNETYLNSLCTLAKEVYDETKQREEDLGALVMAVNSLYMEETGELYMNEGFVILAKKILSAN